MSLPDPAQAWPDLAGRLIKDDAGVSHILPVRVYFEDTDFSGFVYHGSYVRWCERGRSDFLRLLGSNHRDLDEGAEEREPAAFVVRRMRLDFLKPARIDDILTIRTRIKEIGAATLTLDQAVHRNEACVLEAEVMVVLVSRSGKPQRLGRMIRDALARA